MPASCSQEILFGPLTGIEVLNVRVDGSVIIIECAFSINLTALTLEQVLEKRLKFVRDLAANMFLEVRAELAGTGAETEQAEWLRDRLNEKVLHQAPNHFNNDESFVRDGSVVHRS